MIEILECTLRDASYPISYQFTPDDTSVLSLGLYQSGFTRIEIGHGLGLGASGDKYGIAAASDEEYAAAASYVLPKGIFGFFAIPGIANINSINLISKYNGGFVRIGTDVNDSDKAESFIKHSKDLGLEVSSNLMKTYSASVNEVVDRAMRLQEWGADIVAVVDSAGGMMGDSVADYVSALVKGGISKVGFHGHNNLQLAVSNSIIAINNGATIVDTTLRGMGRSAGNAQTEALVLCLDRLGYKTGIDIIKMLDISNKIIAPISNGKGSNDLEVVSGFSLFHSGYQEIVEKYAIKNRVDTRKLIIQIGDGFGQKIDEKYISESSQKIKLNEVNFYNNSDNIKFENSSNLILSEYISAIDIANELSSWAKKSGNKSIFTISRGASKIYSKPFIRTSNGIVVSNIEIDDPEKLDEIIKNVIEKVDYILIDTQLSNNLKYNDKIINFSESNAKILALDSFINCIDKSNSLNKIGVLGINPNCIQFLQILIQQDKKIFVESENIKVEKLISLLKQLNEIIPEINYNNLYPLSNNKEIDILITFENSENELLKIINSNLKTIKYVIDASLFSINDKILHFLKENNIHVYRIDMRAALVSEVLLRLESKKLVDEVCGQFSFDNVRIIAGGFIGFKGDIIIDSINNPRKIIGVADGLGGILTSKESEPYLQQINKVKTFIFNKLLKP